jgi:DNA-binding phage protein
MKFRYKTAAYAMMPVLGFGILGANPAAAQGMMGIMTQTPEQIADRQTTLFQQEATILGVTVDEVKAAWASGKSMKQLATEKGITQEQIQTRLKDAATAQLKTQLQALVDKGIVTQAQADARLQFMQTKIANSKSGKHGMMGFGNGWHF